MPLFYTITYQPGGQTEKFYGTAGRRYRVAGDDLIDLHSHPVWCFRCGKVTEGERIESVRELDEKIKNLERLAGEIRAEARAEGRFTHDEPADHVQQSDLAHLGQRRRWRVARQSPLRGCVRACADRGRCRSLDRCRRRSARQRRPGGGLH